MTLHYLALYKLLPSISVVYVCDQLSLNLPSET